MTALTEVVMGLLQSAAAAVAGERPVGRSAPPDRQAASLHEICGSFPRIQSSQPQFAKSLALLPEMPLFICGVCYNLVRAFEGRWTLLHGQRLPDPRYHDSHS